MTTDILHKRFVAVLNKKIDAGIVMNALAHMAAGFVAQYPDLTELRFDTYTDADGNKHKSISDHPFIILSAKNSNKIRAMREVLIELGISFVDFTSTMTVGTYAEQKERTAQTAEADLEYYGICTFADNKTLSGLTSKFSLWK